MREEQEAVWGRGGEVEEIHVIQKGKRPSCLKRKVASSMQQNRWLVMVALKKLHLNFQLPINKGSWSN